MIAGPRGRAGKANVAVYRDEKNGVIHSVLSEKASAKYLKEPKPEAVVTVQPVQTPAPPPPQPQPVVVTEESEPAEPVVEDWKPLPDEWFAAIVRKIKVDYGFADLSNGDSVYIYFDSVIPHEYGHCLRVGDEVAVTLKRNTEGTAMWVAPQCQVEKMASIERGLVSVWWSSNQKGLVKLDCGCLRKVITGTPVLLSEGDRVRISSLVPDRNNEGKFIARAIEVEEEE